VFEREIVGAFNAIDLESQGWLERNNFLYCVTAHINKLLTNEESLSKKTQGEWNGRSQLAVIDGKSGSPKKDNFN
jgi:hypothetical protein